MSTDNDITITDEIIVPTFTPHTPHIEMCDRILSECRECSDHFGLVPAWPNDLPTVDDVADQMMGDRDRFRQAQEDMMPREHEVEEYRRLANLPQPRKVRSYGPYILV